MSTSASEATQRDARRSPLEQWHIRAGAKMVDFHGWHMPLHYTKVSDEVLATRRQVGLFDLCHMGRIQIRGRDRVAFVDSLYTNSVEKMAEGEVQYGFLCNDSSGVIDDITVYRHDEYLMLVVNASNAGRVLEWLNQYRGSFEVQIDDKTVSLAMCAVQGPKAHEIVAQMSSQPLEKLGRYHFQLARILSRISLISRTGYTGEDGFEIYFGRAYAEEIWEALMRAAKVVGGVPVGLAARDVLRIEAALPLHGQELSEKISPIEAGLDRFVDFDKLNFIGRREMLTSTNSDLSMRLVTFEMGSRAIPRTGYPICHRNTACGRVTSGTYSPTLGKAIGMGYVEQAMSSVGQDLQIRIRDQYQPAVVVRRPFYRRGKTGS